MIPNRVPMPFACRVMRLAADPHHADELYAVLEVNGVMRSRDGGGKLGGLQCGADPVCRSSGYKNHLVTEVEAERMPGESGVGDTERSFINDPAGVGRPAKQAALNKTALKAHAPNPCFPPFMAYSQAHPT
jgi:hypothetical protein